MIQKKSNEDIQENLKEKKKDKTKCLVSQSLEKSYVLFSVDSFQVGFFLNISEN